MSIVLNYLVFQPFDF